MSHTESSGRNTKARSANRVYEDSPHGDAQQTHQAEGRWLLQHPWPRSSVFGAESDRQKFNRQFYPKSKSTYAFLKLPYVTRLYYNSFFLRRNIFVKALWSAERRRPPPQRLRTRPFHPEVCTGLDVGRWGKRGNERGKGKENGNAKGRRGRKGPRRRRGRKKNQRNRPRRVENASD